MTQENNVPRYDIRVYDSTDEYAAYYETHPSQHGDYCRWEDVEAEIMRLNKQIQDLRLKLINTLCP